MTTPLSHGAGIIIQRLCLAIIGAATLSFGGCTMVGPDYGGVASPLSDTPYMAIENSQLPEYVPATSLAMTDEQLASGWDQFNDPNLIMLIDLAMQDNLTAKELYWRISEAQSLVCIVSGQKMPFADLVKSTEARKSSSSSEPFVASNADPFGFVSVGVNSRWEIDLFGRIARETQAATADYQATIEDLSDLRRVLLADVAKEYINVRLYQELMKQNESNIKIQQQSIEQANARIKAGKVSRLDLVQVETRVGLTASDTPFFEEQYRLSLNRLAILLGQSPNMGLQLALGDKPQLSAPLVTPDLPAELLRRRPDVRRSEREVAAASARIGVAEAALYPRLSLVGSVSLDSRKLSDLLDYDSLVFGVGPSFTWNILTLGRVERQIDIQKAQLKQAVARYHQNVLIAVTEVENSLVSYQQNAARVEMLTKTVKDAGEAVRLAAEQYNADRVSIERVVSGHRRLLQASASLVQARAALATASVDLMQSLGGAWREPAIQGGCEWIADSQSTPIVR